MLRGAPGSARDLGTPEEKTTVAGHACLFRPLLGHQEKQEPCVFHVAGNPFTTKKVLDTERLISFKGDEARGLGKVLELFAPHADLLRGHDGGMNKSGTMEGVSTLAGYADTASHGRVRFVISLTSNNREMRFRLLRAMSPSCSGTHSPPGIDVSHGRRCPLAARDLGASVALKLVGRRRMIYICE